MDASSWLGKTWASLFAQLNWFRIHLLAFTIIPFIFSGFFMAANPSSASGQFSTSYIDALFMCFSAMTVTGLSTLSLSELRPAQQAFLLILMLVGDISIVNLVTIFCRQIWFVQNCGKVVHSTILSTLHAKHKSSSGYDDAERGQQKETGIEGEGDAQRGGGGTQPSEMANRKPDNVTNGGNSRHKNRESDEEKGQREHKGWERADGTEQDASNQRGPNRDRQPRSSQSSETLEEHRQLLKPSSSEHNSWEEGVKRRAELRRRSGHKPRTPADRPQDPHRSIPHASSGRALHTGRGGFPSLHRIIYHLLHRTFPNLYTSLDNLLRHYETEGVHSSHPIRSLGKALGKPLEDHRDANEEIRAKNAKWLPPGVRGVVVGRNSQFFEEELDDEDLELIGALEYRATKVLTILLIVHQLFWMLIPSAILAIYFAKIHTWDTAFTDNGVYQAGTVSSTWYSFFQVVSAYTSCGLSLVDILMVPFQNCYLLIYVLIFPMLAGNQAIPLFLRAELWLLTKVVKKGSELEVSLHFLLTHSRRLFLYLFPAYQTWYLVFVQFALTAIGVLGYVAFDHGLPYYKSISTAWDNFTIGFFESLSVRASGFGIVFISDIAPATIFLYLMLIFTCNYPLVMAIRSTNVYEERALGLHGEHAPHQHNQQKQNGEIFSKYLRHHLLPQIFFDLWPVAIGTLFICVVERGKLMNTNNVGWLGVWQILFEVTSGYGTVGLSFGNPYNTSSLSASFRKISKLIMIIIMLRGRHRGLPLAIDRATMYPIEYLRLTGGEDEKAAESRVQNAGEEAEAQ